MYICTKLLIVKCQERTMLISVTKYKAHNGDCTTLGNDETGYWMYFKMIYSFLNSHKSCANVYMLLWDIVLYIFLSNRIELSLIFVAFTFQCHRCSIIEPGICLTVGSDTFYSPAKSSLLYVSWHRHWSGVFESRLQLSRICGRANSEKVGCSYILFVLFFPILDLYLELLRNENVLRRARDAAPFVCYILNAIPKSTSLVEFSFHATGGYGERFNTWFIRFLKFFRVQIMCK